MNSCVLLGTRRVANMKSFLMWKSCTFSMSLLNFFGPFSSSCDPFMKMTDEEFVGSFRSTYRCTGMLALSDVDHANDLTNDCNMVNDSPKSTV